MNDIIKVGAPVSKKKLAKTRRKKPNEREVLRETCMETLRGARAIVVGSPDALLTAHDALKKVKRGRRLWEALLRPGVKREYGVYKESLDELNQLDKPLKAAEEVLKEQIGTWTLAQRRIAEAAQQKALEVASDQQAGLQHMHAAATAEAEQVAVIKRDEEIQAAVATGDLEKAARLRAEPVESIPPPPPMAIVPRAETEYVVPQDDSIAVTEKFDFEVVDESKVTRQFLKVNEKAIRAQVEITKGATSIPGVRIFPKANVRVTV